MIDFDYHSRSVRIESCPIVASNADNVPKTAFQMRIRKHVQNIEEEKQTIKLVDCNKNDHKWRDDDDDKIIVQNSKHRNNNERTKRRADKPMELQIADAS